MASSWRSSPPTIVIPRVLLRLLGSLGLEEGAFLTGSQSGPIIAIDGVAFTKCFESSLGFECLPVPRDEVIGVFHKHVRMSTKDLMMAKLWKVYLIWEGGELLGFSYGSLAEVKVV